MTFLVLPFVASNMLLCATAVDLSVVEQEIKQPGAAYSTGPLWVWNDMLSPEQLEHCLDALVAQNVRQVWVHPRPGLMTPYLSEDWFALWDATLAAARKRDMLVWIYDENSYPSGFAGGNVPEEMPESRGLGITLHAEKRVAAYHENMLAVYRKTEEGYENITDEAARRNGAIEGELMVARVMEAPQSPWFGGKTYVDLLRPGVTEKFLAVTLEPYRKRFGGEFGKLIPGSFTDEPHLKPCGDIHWTPDLPDVFLARWGEAFLDGLPHLRDDSEAGRRFRYCYLCTLNELFVERWAKPYFNYCEKYDLDFTGHYWEHEWPNCASVPDNMAMGAWQQRPGIDTLFNQYNEGPHAQFGNVRAVIELASVARQTGRKRTLCEAYGGSGAEMRFEDYKRIGDWLQVLGVNTLNEHLSDVTIRGARKRDYPPTFSYHSPWMREYQVLEDYFTRLSYALSQGQQINRCIILEPTTTAWMHHFTDNGRLAALGDGFQLLVTNLAKEQLEFDLGSEAVIGERGGVVVIDGQTALKVGECAYTAVVIPAEMENLNRAVYDLLVAYLEKGGVVFSCAPPALPSHIDGKPDEACAALRDHANWTLVSADALAARVNERCKPSALVALSADNAGIVYHHRRQLADGDILFITNISNDAAASGSVIAQAAGVREADLNTGAVRGYAFAKKGGQVEAPFGLPPCGSLMLFLDKKTVAAPLPEPPAGERTLVSVGEIEALRLDDNNLILDYVDAQAGKESAANVYWKKAAEITFKQNGLRGNIWDHCVQFRDELLQTEFAEDSGFTATYRFTIEEAVPATLYAVVERADLYAITCNDAPVAAADGAWWLDRAFGKIDIAAAARVGENVLTLTARPMTVFHELEAAHIVGDFSLKPAEKGFVIAPAAPLGVGAWTEQGLPLYGHRVAYKATITVEQPNGRYVVSLPAWEGVVAQALVNGKDAGAIYLQPHECDITKAIQAGENTIEIVVYGSLRNTLGPHHGDAGLGLTHPGSWNNAPESGPPAGATYFAMKYGLLAPFEVWRY
ncbi:MAG TPA: hypothetical protein ENN29_11470 [Candidatus Hydrogenedentes bacterium]|nr:hypothetical protein [Candidatus Hydrogenedentota bacterium]